MFLHLGDNKVISSDDIIGIFEYDVEKFSTDTIQFLRTSEEEGFVEYANRYNSTENIKSIIIAEVEKRCKIFLSTISIATLKKKIDGDMNKNINK